MKVDDDDDVMKLIVLSVCVFINNTSKREGAFIDGIVTSGEKKQEE